MSDPLVTTRLIREAFSRGLILGLTLLVAAAVILGLTWLIVPGLMKSETLPILLTVFCGGFVVTPIAFIERVAGRVAPSDRRDALAALAAGAAALVAGLLLGVEVIYVERLQSSGWDARGALSAAEDVWEVVKDFCDRPGDPLVFSLVIFGIPAAPAVVGRLRGWSLAGQLGFVFGATLVGNLIVAGFIDKSGAAFVALVTALVASFTPIMFRWGDAAEALWARALARDDDDAR